MESSKNKSAANADNAEGGEIILAPTLSRRDALRLAGGGAASLLLTELLSGPAHARTRVRLQQMQGIHANGVPPPPPSSPNLSALQLPFWGDGAAFDQPQYYQTIQAGRRPSINKTVQSADIDGDGQDELIARSPTGITAHHFDPHSGQWLPMTNGPAWSDPGVWFNSSYYQTIQTADIDGDGRAELLGLNSANIEAWRYDPNTQTWNQLADGPPWGQFDNPAWFSPQYYQTIQCADIDGDGKAELLAHAPDDDPNGGGIQVWKYNPGSNSWSRMPGLQDENFFDQFMNLPFSYQSLQCADIDGDGQAEVVGGGFSSNIFAWKYNPVNQTWNQLAGGPPWSIDNTWGNAPYYQTIQCADIDGDGKAELLGRAPDNDPNGFGVQVWKYNPGSNSWSQMPSYPNWTDYWGWNNPQYYQTIQCADINGDGAAELISRAPDTYPGGGGIKIGKYTANNQQWNEYPTSIAWTDNPANSNDGKTAWDEVQYFSAIQTARVFGDATAQDLTQDPPVNPNTNNPAFTDGQGKNKAVPVILGRNVFSLQTWRFNAANYAASQWNRTSAPFPSYASSAVPAAQVQAYDYLNQTLPFDTSHVGVDLRAAYPDLSASDVSQYLGNFPTGNPLTGQGVSDFDWNAVRNHIHDELIKIQNALTTLGAVNNGLVSNTVLGNINLDVINQNLKDTKPHSNSPGGSSGLFVTLVEIITSAIWAISAVADPPLAVITGLIASASIGLSLFPDPDESYTYGDGDAEFTRLKNDLANGFQNTMDANGFGTTQFTRDWGLLQIEGLTGISAIDPSLSDYADANYRLYAYKKLAPIFWAIGALTTSDLNTYANAGGGSDGYVVQNFKDLVTSGYYLSSGGVSYFPAALNVAATAVYDLPPDNDTEYQVAYAIDGNSTAMQDLFGTLNASPEYFANNNPGDGWGQTPNSIQYFQEVDDNDFMWIRDYGRSTSALGPPSTPFKGTRLAVGTKANRDVASGEIVVTVTIKNTGTKGVTNLRLNEAKLGATSARLPSHWTRLRAARSETVTLRFPANTGTAGKKAILQLQGRHKRGSFGGSVRVTLP